MPKMTFVLKDGTRQEVEAPLGLSVLEIALGEDLGYVVVAWLCWVPNLLVAEWLIRTGRWSRPEPALVGTA